MYTAKARRESSDKGKHDVTKIILSFQLIHLQQQTIYLGFCSSFNLKLMKFPLHAIVFLCIYCWHACLFNAQVSDKKFFCNRGRLNTFSATHRNCTISTKYSSSIWTNNSTLQISDRYSISPNNRWHYFNDWTLTWTSIIIQHNQLHITKVKMTA